MVKSDAEVPTKVMNTDIDAMIAPVASNIPPFPVSIIVNVICIIDRVVIIMGLSSVKKSIGIDPLYGSGNLAIVATQLIDGKIQVIEASEYQRPNFIDMIEKIWQLKQQYGHISNIYVDAANPEVWQALEREFSENHDDHYVKDQIADYRKYNLHIEDRMF